MDKPSKTKKPSASDIIYLVLVLLLVASTLIYVFVKKLDDTPETIDLRYIEHRYDYDLSVLNSADVNDYMEVSGIGEVKANDIVSYRDALGGFESVYQLLDLDSINEKLFEAILEHFYFSENDLNQPSETTTASLNEEPTVTTSLTTTVDVTSSESSKATSSETKKTKESEEVTTSDGVNDEVVIETEPSPVDLNSCTASQLEALGLSCDQAQAIISLRDKIGYYSDIREIMLTGVIPKETFKEIKNYIFV